MSFADRCAGAGSPSTRIWRTSSGYSAFLVLDEADIRALLVEERVRLGEVSPTETVEETYLVNLLVAASSTGVGEGVLPECRVPAEWT